MLSVNSHVSRKTAKYTKHSTGDTQLINLYVENNKRDLNLLNLRQFCNKIYDELTEIFEDGEGMIKSYGTKEDMICLCKIAVLGIGVSKTDR